MIPWIASAINIILIEYTIKKICKHDEGFIVVGDTRDTEEIAFHVEFFVTYPYIAYYNDDGLVWSYVDKQIGYGNYMDAVVVNNEVVAIGSYETGDGTSKLLLTRFNQFGNVKSRVEFDANKSTFGYRILYDNKKK